jgi:hypothetical protein
MESELSLQEVLTRLRTQIGHHREQEGFHTGQESFHREQREAHAAELERLTRHLEALEGALAMAGELAASLPAPARDEPVGGPRRMALQEAVFAVVQTLGAREPFEAGQVAEEVNRRFGARLKHPTTPLRVSVVLRRFSRARRVFALGKGRPHHPVRYVREVPKAG